MNKIKIDGAMHWPDGLQMEAKMICEGKRFSAFSVDADGLTVFGPGFWAWLAARFPWAARFTNFDDRLISGNSHPFRPGPLLDINIDDTQEAALEAALHSDIGILNMEHGRGHIVTGMEIIRRRRTGALVICNSAAMAARWGDALEKDLGTSPGLLMGDKWDHKPGVCVSTYDDLIRHIDDKAQIDPGLVLMDECDAVSIETIQRIIRRMRARYRYGFTAMACAPVFPPALHFELGALVFSSEADLGPGEVNWGDELSSSRAV